MGTRTRTTITTWATALAVTVLAMVGAFFFEPFEHVASWTRRYEGWQVDEIIVVPFVLTILFAFYLWRRGRELGREVAERKREIQEREHEVAERERAEETLRRSEARYRAVVTGSPVALFAVDPEGMFTLSEGKSLEVLGLEPDKVVGRSIFETYRHAPQIVENVRRALAGQASSAIVEVDGLVFETWYSPFRESGEFAGVVGVVTNITERKQAEQNLHESERRLSTLLTNAPAYLYRCRNEPGWPNEFVSDYAHEFTGYTPEELTDGSIMFGDLIVEEDRQRVWDEVQTALAKRRRFALRYAIRRRDGEIRYVEEHGQGAYGEYGRVEALEGVVFDVTERERAEQRLREAEERYRTLVEQIPAVTYIDRADGSDEPLYTSPQIEEMLGYTPEEWQSGRLWYERLHPEDRSRVLAADERFEAGGESFSEEYRLIAKDGSVVWVREEAVVIKDKAGHPIFWQGVIFDITDHKEAEQRLQEAEARYRSLVEHVPAVIYLQKVEHEGAIAYISPQIEGLMGYSSQEYTNDPHLWIETTHPEDRQRVLAEDARTDETGEPFRVEYRKVTRDGRVIWVRDEAILIRDQDGRPLYWQGIAVDITEQKKAEERLRETEARYRALVEQVPAVTYTQELGGTGAVTYISPQIETVLGYTAQECMSEPGFWAKVLHPDDRERVLAEDQRTNQTGEPFSIEYRQIAKDGHVVWIRDEAVLVRDDTGKPSYWHGVLYDITGRKRAEEALRKSEASLAEAQRMAHLGSWEWDLKTQEVLWSDEVFRIYGFEPAEFVPTFEKLMEVVHPEDRQLLREKIEGALYRGEPYDFEHRVVRPGGEERVVHRRAEVVVDEAGEPLRMVGTVHDVTERKALEERLKHQALHDPLTGLPNRLLFTDRLKEALRRAKRRGGKVALLFMDLDNFKIINDSLGHEVGDKLLVLVSRRLREITRPEDTVARFGGDEFIFLMEDIDEASVVSVAERVLEELRAPFALRGREVVVTPSIGITVAGEPGKQAADLLRDADLAMYRAKHSGKSRYAIFEEAMNARALERLEMGNDLRQAVEREEFVIHYQPIVELGTEQVLGFEALVRWDHPGRGLMLPEEFIELAEETGSIVPIDQWTLRETCHQAEEWRRYFGEPPVMMFVNLSARQFHAPELTSNVARALEETGFDPRNLCVEITESTAMGDAPTTIATLEELKSLGVKVVIDDFGTGYSSLSYLERFPVNYVKIDRSFVGKLGQDAGSTVLVSGMIDLSHALGLKVIAEGVETAEQAQVVGYLGCDLAQGNHFSKPLLHDAASMFLERHGL